MPGTRPPDRATAHGAAAEEGAQPTGRDQQVVLKDLHITQETLMKEHHTGNLRDTFLPLKSFIAQENRVILCVCESAFYLLSIRSQSFPSTITQFVAMEMTIMPQTGTDLHGKRQQE